MKTRVGVIMIVVLCVLLALPSPARATAPEPLMIEVDMWLTGETSAAGTFEASGLFTDDGTVSEVFFIAANTSHGVKTIVSPAGTITIKYQVLLTWTSPTTGVAEGRFVIISGTGAYERLHGVGETHAELDLMTGHLLASYTGTAHFD